MCKADIETQSQRRDLGTQQGQQAWGGPREKRDMRPPRVRSGWRVGSSTQHRDDPEAGSRGHGREAPEGGARWICVRMVYTGMCIHGHVYTCGIHGHVYAYGIHGHVYAYDIHGHMYTYGIHSYMYAYTYGIGEGNGTALQCSCLGNPRFGGAWWAAVYGVTQSQTRLKRLAADIWYTRSHVCVYIWYVYGIYMVVCMCVHMVYTVICMSIHIVYTGICTCIHITGSHCCAAETNTAL